MPSKFLKDKAREISYALVRVAFYVKRADLRARLDSLGFELLENVARAAVEPTYDNCQKATAVVSALDSLVRLGHSIYEIEPVNATILVRELDSLNSAMRQYGFPTEDPAKQDNAASPIPDAAMKNNEDQALRYNSGQGLNIENFFSNTPAAIPKNETEDISPSYYVNENKDDISSREAGQSENNSAINAAIRQSAIFTKIKSGNGNGSRLKDLVAEFPDVSERTLRYDLQRLCGQGLIERVGNGGPASYYRAVAGTNEVPTASLVYEGKAE